MDELLLCISRLLQKKSYIADLAKKSCGGRTKLPAPGSSPLQAGDLLPPVAWPWEVRDKRDAINNNRERPTLPGDK